MQKDMVRQRLLSLIKENDTDLKALSKVAGRNDAYVQQYLKRGSPRKLPHEVALAFAEYFNVPEADFLDRPRSRDRQLALDFRIPEIDVRAGAGMGGESILENFTDDGKDIVSAEADRGYWQMPAEYLAAEIRVRRGQVRIIEVIGDSMKPTLESGDRVMVNMADKTPSPPGIFALFDGLGPVVKRIEHIPNSDPVSVRIISDNAHHTAYDRTAEEVNIIGRVVWFARRL